MNRHDIQLLQQIKGYPAATITMPTYRTSPENQKDPIRLKNLVKNAVDRLLGEFNKREIELLLANLEHLVDGIDHQHNLDGLALFVNRDFSRAVQLPFRLEERVVIEETFRTRDLVFALNRTARYWVLVLSEKPSRLYEATRENLAEVREGGFPLTHEGPGGEQSLPGGFGVQKSAYRDEYHRQFFRRVDVALDPILKNDPLPLVVVGVDRYLAFFHEVTNHKDAILTTINGSHDKTSAHELGRLVWPQVEGCLAEQRKGVFAELEKAVGERRFASGPGEVWRLAMDGRGRLLLVEEGFHFPARADETGRNIIPAENPESPDVLHDAVDDIIETVLSRQGQVVFVEKGQLALHQHIALILRY